MSQRLSKNDFDYHIARAIRWFGIKNMDKDRSSTIYRGVMPFPVEAFKVAIDQIIDERRPSPGYFPTTVEIQNKCRKYIDENPSVNFALTDFDRVEDFRYPVSKLWEGLNVLQDYGRDSFLKWAERNRMPSNDIERVLNKDRAIRLKKDAAEAATKIAVKALVDKRKMA